MTRIRWPAALWLALAALSLWLRGGFPITALGGAGADDALFVRLAQSLAQGGWLGPYDNLTLAKGMFYPLFIAGSALAGVPLKLAEQAAYLAMAAGLALYAGRRTRWPHWGTVLFAVLALNPILWDRQLARVIREALYLTLSPALLGLVVALCFGARRRAMLAVAAGAVGAAFWLTREEGVWLLPALATVLALSAGRILLTDGPRIPRLAGWAGGLLLAGLVFAAGNAAVAELNRRHYGTFVTTEFKSRAFERGYGALAGIRHDDWRPYVVLPHDARQRAYAASPAARELSPFLDGPIGEGWRRVGCDTMGLTPQACPEILAAWFMWALRDSVAAAGYGKSAKDAARFYDRLADELGAACDGGGLACTAPHRATLLPPFRTDYLRPAVTAAVGLARLVLALGGPNPPPDPSSGRPSELSAFRDMVGPVSPPAGGTGQDFVGWAAAGSGTPSFTVRPAIGTMPTVVPAIRDGADLEQLFPGFKAIRFELAATCQPGTCDLLLTAPGAAPATIPWAALQPGSVLATPELKLWIDSAAPFQAAPVTAERQGVQRRIAAAISRAYRIVTPVAALLGLLGLGLAAWRRRTALPLFALAAAAFVAVASRIALLAYLDATSIPSVNSLYAAPAVPFVLIGTVLGLAVGWDSVRRSPQTFHT